MKRRQKTSIINGSDSSQVVKREKPRFFRSFFWDKRECGDGTRTNICSETGKNLEIEVISILVLAFK